MARLHRESGAAPPLEWFQPPTRSAVSSPASVPPDHKTDEPKQPFRPDQTSDGFDAGVAKNRYIKKQMPICRPIRPGVPMQVFYINLDSQPERRAFIEANFKAHNREGWKLTRVAAVDKAALVGSPQALPPVRPGELACFLSHLKVMDLAQDIDGDIMVIEDDALFGPNSQQAIRTIISLSPRANWDMLATDVCITNPLQMIQLLAQRRKQPDRVEIMDLKSFAFAGSTAYVINHERKAHVLAALKASLPLAMSLRSATAPSLLR